MALDPRIALQTKSVDLGQVGQSFLQSQQASSNIDARNRQLNLAEQKQATQDKLADATVLQNQFKNLQERDQARLKSTTITAVRLNNFLKNNDVEGARNFLKSNKQDIEKQKELGIDIDTTETDEALELLDTNIEGLKKVTDGAVDLGRQLGFLKDPRTEGKTPSAVQEFEFFEGLSPEQQKTFLSVKRQNQGFFIDPKTGAATPVEGFTGVRKDIKAAEAAGTKEGGLEAEKTFNIPKAKASFAMANDKLDNVLTKIDQVVPNVNELTAGFGGALLSKIPGTKARDLEATIQTIVANLGFRELQDMRDSSPTGGALGQVSERELALLNSAKQNLENSQTPEQLKENLGDLKAQMRLSKKRIKEAYELDFGRFDKQMQNIGKKPTPKETQDQVIDFNDL